MTNILQHTHTTMVTSFNETCMKTCCCFWKEGERWRKEIIPNGNKSKGDNFVHFICSVLLFYMFCLSMQPRFSFVPRAMNQVWFHNNNNFPLHFFVHFFLTKLNLILVFWQVQLFLSLVQTKMYTHLLVL